MNVSIRSLIAGGPGGKQAASTPEVECLMNRGLSLIFALLLFYPLATARSEASLSRDCAAPSPGVQQLAKIENTRDSSYNCLGLSVDSRANILGIRFEKHASADRGGAGKDTLASSIHEYTPAEIGAAQGVVLDGTPGHDAVRLRGPIPAGTSFASLVVSYLHNGIDGEFRECTVSLERDQASRWRLVDADRRPISFILVRTWALPILGTVGIDTLQGVCPGRGSAPTL